jgi:hypothetical protein
MAASEIADFLGIVTADYNYTLAIKAQGSISEEGFKNQVIHLADDSSEERITLSTGSIFYITYPINLLSESDSGIIHDLYHDAAKANGMANSFYLTTYDSSGVNYVVRFDCKLTRSGNSVNRWGMPGIRFRVLGKVS